MHCVHYIGVFCKGMQESKAILYKFPFFLISFTHQIVRLLSHCENTLLPKANWESLGEFPLSIFYSQLLPGEPKRMSI